MTQATPMPHDLVAELRQLIESARQRAAVAVNAELSLLYWQVGQRIHRNILGSQRAGYGEAIVPALAQQLSAAYGRGWGVRHLRLCIRFAERYPDAAIVHIHTYKFNEAVADKVVLDLKYEARAVPQRLTSPKAVDAWFEKAAKGLNNYQKSMLRKRWATMEDLMSSGERKQRIMADIIHDFGVRPRLNNDRGTAILVAASIYDACHYYRLFQNTSFGQHCGIITSFEPNHNAISQEPKDSDERYKFDTYTQHVLKPGQTTTQYETEAKRCFIEEPANLKLLIVVSKLLTGFDAPSCTYIYLDNELRDHNLFQAICRTNRLDGEDKDYGHIVDYKESLENVQKALPFPESPDGGAVTHESGAGRFALHQLSSFSTSAGGSSSPGRRVTRSRPLPERSMKSCSRASRSLTSGRWKMSPRCNAGTPTAFRLSAAVLQCSWVLARMTWSRNATPRP